MGLAVGDALGYPAEFRSRSLLLSLLGENALFDFVGINDSVFAGVPPYIFGAEHPPGSFTDDTQMSLCVAEALLRSWDASLPELMKDMARHFVAWSQSPENDRAPGSSCMTGCENLSQGLPWYEAGVAQSKGCGSAMRVAPIGLVYSSNRRRLLEVARASSLPTHGHDAAVEGAAAAALLVAMALEGASPEMMWEHVLQECGPRSSDFRECWETLPAFLSEPPEKALSKDGLGEGWVAEEAVASALYCYWRHPNDFVAAVHMAALTDGDSDTLACITGGISGAALGLEALPLSWRQRVEQSDRLHEVGAQLWEAAQRVQRQTQGL